MMRKVVLNLGLVLLVAFGALVRFYPYSQGRQVSRLIELLHSLARVTPSPRATAQIRRGYYEKLAGAGQRQMGLPLFEIAPADYRACLDLPFGDPRSILERSKDWRNGHLKPSFTTTCWGGVPWRSNKQGYRGAEWGTPEHDPPGTLRLAFLGSSHVYGSGVREEDAFPSLFEQRWNAAGQRHVKVMNFGSPGYTIVDQVAVIDDALAAQPGAILVIGHGDADVDHILTRLGRGAGEGTLREDQIEVMPLSLRAIFERGQPQTRAEGLALVNDAYVESLKLIHAAAAAKGLPLYFTELRVLDSERITRSFAKDAARLGYAVISFDGVYGDREALGLKVHEYDVHPSPEAHGLIADRLVRELSPVLH